MADVTTEIVDSDGLDATYNAASAGGDRFDPAPGTVLHVVNDSAGSVTVTFVTEATADGLDIADPDVTIPAGESRFIEPPSSRLLEDDDGLAAVTWSDETSVTFAVIHAAA